MEAKVPPATSPWHPSHRALVKGSVKACAASTVPLSVLLILAQLIFLGSGWAPDTQYARIRVAVLDLDGSLVGGALRGASAHLPFSVTTYTNLTMNAGSLTAAVNRGDFHAGLLAVQGATGTLAAALAAARANPGSPLSYDATAAVQFIYDEGRLGPSLGALLRSVVTQLIGGVSAAAEQAMMGSPAPAIAPAVSFSLVNLHPVPHAGMALSAGISYIVCWITMLAATQVMLEVYNPWEKAGIHPAWIVFARVLHEVAVSLCLSFWPPCVNQWLGDKLHGDKFFAFWAYVWLSMLTFGMCITALMRCACLPAPTVSLLLTVPPSALRLLGPKIGSLVHLVFLILNLVSSGSITAMELEPPFFQIGMGLPFYNAVAGTRTILFGSYNHLGRNVGVLFAWVGLSWALAATRLLRLHLKSKAQPAVEAADEPPLGADGMEKGEA